MCMQCNSSSEVLVNSAASSENQFAGKVLEIMNHGALSLMISVGHRTHLFDIMAKLPPSTSEEIAHQAELNERYVREWLGAMVTGEIVEYDPILHTYLLPQEHAAFLTRQNTADNIATLAQFIPLLGSVENQIVKCFRKGGGVPYSAFPRFQEVMADESGQTVMSSLLDKILPLVPGLIEKLNTGIKVLDVGCGRGKALLLMAKHFPNSHFTGYDISQEGISGANAEAEAMGLTNIRFVIQDAASFSDTESFDFIATFDSVHDQAKPAEMLKNIYRALHNDGVYLMQDIDASSDVGNNVEHPIGPLLYTISCMHCMTVSLAENGAGLGAVWGVELAEQMLHEAGFRSVEINRLPHDIQNCYYIVRK